ncbi:hypothetical protein A8C56_17055 [Niabella ginsenosidivorans]|uniref:Uncharacterized protein n=1 Tax=Niabella ginsenosidivorans TaxID=1176587 RepID=A0A1A9I451_9BACT|nr:hypothetical protein [Niabella ginsenosidivorans]ANH82448.1 hypothetical protein A8C56_17055 [Niabella ginsenosidivorans]
MDENIKDILSHLNKNISQETLLKYLNEQLGKEEQHEVEKQLMEDNFDNDAVEGLQSVQNPARLTLIAEALNRDLKKRTQKKRAAIRKRQLQPQWTLYFSIIILLILLVLVYLFLYRHINN